MPSETILADFGAIPTKSYGLTGPTGDDASVFRGRRPPRTKLATDTSSTNDQRLVDYNRGWTNADLLYPQADETHTAKYVWSPGEVYLGAPVCRFTVNDKQGKWHGATIVASAKAFLDSDAFTCLRIDKQGSFEDATGSIQTYALNYFLAAEYAVHKSVVASDLERQVVALRSLKANWDGYGAAPLSAFVIDQMANDLQTILADNDCPSPDLTPGADGSLAAEWHRDQIEVIYNIDADGERSLWFCEGETASEHFGEEALNQLRELAGRLT